jgi:hypothetical protein
MESAIFALIGVLVGGGMLAMGMLLLWAILQSRGNGDGDMVNCWTPQVQRCMDRAALFEAGRDHALRLKEIEQFERHQYPKPQVEPEPRIVVVVASAEQAASLARR